MSQATFDQCLSLLERTMEAGQNAGAFNMSFAHVMRLCLKLLQKETQARLKNGDVELTRSMAANHLKSGLAIVQQKGGVIGNIETGIRLKQAAELLIQIESANATAMTHVEPIVYDEATLLNDQDKEADTIAEIGAALRPLAESAQLMGSIKFEMLEAVETALRRLEKSEGKEHELSGLEEALPFIDDFCEGIQVKGGLLKTLADASKYRRYLLKLATIVASLKGVKKEDDSVMQIHEEDDDEGRSIKRSRA